MPRLDNCYEVIEYFGLEFDDIAPGMTGPVDLCFYCWDIVDLSVDDLEIAHPTYDDDVYYCARCGIGLDGDDD